MQERRVGRRVHHDTVAGLRAQVQDDLDPLHDIVQFHRVGLVDVPSVAGRAAADEHVGGRRAANSQSRGHCGHSPNTQPMTRLAALPSCRPGKDPSQVSSIQSP